MKLKIHMKEGIVIKSERLDEYQKLAQEIELLNWKIRKLEMDLKQEKPHNPKDSIALRLEENIKRNKAYLSEKEQAMEALMIMIDSFKGLENQLLRMRYIEGMTLKEIAEKLTYNYQYIVNVHASILKAIKITEDVL